VLRAVLTAGALFVLLCGCGSDGKVAPVSGVVTLNGKPIADIAVTFQPLASDGKNVAGPTAFGVTGPDGRYTVKLYGTETKGATVGKNQVRFCGYAAPTDMTDEALAKAKPKVNIPTRYWNESKIEFEVPPKGTSSADFQLKSP
jgi:hypothetical protein